MLIPTHLLGFDGALCGEIPKKALPASEYHKLRLTHQAEPEPPVCGWCTLVYSHHNERIQEDIQQEQMRAISLMRGRA